MKQNLKQLNQNISFNTNSFKINLDISNNCINNDFLQNSIRYLLENYNCNILQFNILNNVKLEYIFLFND